MWSFGQQLENKQAIIVTLSKDRIIINFEIFKKYCPLTMPNPLVELW